MIVNLAMLAISMFIGAIIGIIDCKRMFGIPGKLPLTMANG